MPVPGSPSKAARWSRDGPTSVFFFIAISTLPSGLDRGGAADDEAGGSAESISGMNADARAPQCTGPVRPAPDREKEREIPCLRAVAVTWR